MLKLAIVACVWLGAYAQTTTQPSWSSTSITLAVPDPANVPAEVMTEVIYSSLLERFERNEAEADRVEAKGLDPLHKTRKWLQLQTGLTDQEFASVRPILLHAISETKASKARAEDAFKKVKDANKGEALTPEQKHMLGPLTAERGQITLAHVQQLEAALGSSRFQQFDQAVRTLPGQRITVVPLKK